MFRMFLTTAVSMGVSCLELKGMMVKFCLNAHVHRHVPMHWCHLHIKLATADCPNRQNGNIARPVPPSLCIYSQPNPVYRDTETFSQVATPYVTSCKYPFQAPEILWSKTCSGKIIESFAYNYIILAHSVLTTKQYFFHFFANFQLYFSIFMNLSMIAM